MQSLYESEFHPEEGLAAVADRYLRKSSHTEEDRAYVVRTVAGLQKSRKSIDGMIKKHAPEWPLEQIAGIDRAVLRLGIYEILESAEVPPKVAINEAVEIAKQYGGENSGSFVNGVLGTIYRATDQYRKSAEDTAAAPAAPKAKEPKDVDAD